MRFHVEHFRKTISGSIHGNNSADNGTITKLIRYAELIHSENSKYNLTGHKTIDDIINNLIIESLKPVNLADVPRGTSASDMGTGAGVPGIPLAIIYPFINFTLFDSNSKKIRFIDYVVNELSLPNIKGVCCRIEDAARDSKYRDTFDIVVSRAMSDVYSAAELCSPFLKTDGYLYLYISDKQKNLPSPALEHISKVSLDIIAEGRSDFPFTISTTYGLLLKKNSPVSDIYPRRISAIRRGAAEIEKADL